MKTRNGFVSNSSSSSFVVALSALSKPEVNALMDYFSSEDNTDGWSASIDEYRGIIEGSTCMDNGAFEEFLEEMRINKVRLI
jgi:hypothetical protein